jgi:NADH-quinone oxidoreductase subunit M
MILGAGYSLWLSNRILFGNFKNFSIPILKDLTRLEFYSLVPFVILTFFFGFFPETIISYITVY